MDVVDPDVSSGAVHKETLHHDLAWMMKRRRRRRREELKKQEDRDGMKAGRSRKVKAN